jgi:hypothetical protein
MFQTKSDKTVVKKEYFVKIKSDMSHDHVSIVCPILLTTKSVLTCDMSLHNRQTVVCAFIPDDVRYPSTCFFSFRACDWDSNRVPVDIGFSPVFCTELPAISGETRF